MKYIKINVLCSLINMYLPVFQHFCFTYHKVWVHLDINLAITCMIVCYNVRCYFKPYHGTLAMVFRFLPTIYYYLSFQTLWKVMSSEPWLSFIMFNCLYSSLYPKTCCDCPWATAAQYSLCFPSFLKNTLKSF